MLVERAWTLTDRPHPRIPVGNRCRSTPRLRRRGLEGSLELNSKDWGKSRLKTMIFRYAAPG
jgi:hypothetical protein